MLLTIATTFRHAMIAVAVLAVFAGAGASGETSPSATGVFARPSLHAQLSAVDRLIAERATEQAESALRTLAPALPREDVALRAAALAWLDGNAGDAVDEMRSALAVGRGEMDRFLSAVAMADLADAASGILSSAEAGWPEPEVVSPAIAHPGNRMAEVEVDEHNTVWNPRTASLHPAIAFSPAIARQPVLRAEDTERWAARLRQLVASGAAAGLSGVLYDNRDRSHAALPRQRVFPQMTRVAYGSKAVAAGVDYALNTSILFPAPVIGNSSTAIGRGPFWRSQPRLALTSDGGAGRMWGLYASNHLYVFPEHRDHDMVVEKDGRQRGRGDVFPALTPYTVVAQGSSGSDLPLVEALAVGLAALPPDTRALAEREGLIAPTLQMLLRRAERVVTDEAAYLSRAAHPTVFQPESIDLDRLIDLAQALEPTALPPLVRLSMRDETQVQPRGPDLHVGLGEVLFDTPGAIARVWRGTGYTRSYELDASQTSDPNGRSLDFHWLLVNGNPGNVRITPLDDRGRRVSIEIDWHDPGQNPAGLSVRRVDIAAIADNGQHLSAPAFFSLLFPANETRVYEADGNGGHRVREIDYRAGRTYADPRIFVRRSWRDSFRYSETGLLTGWTRHRQRAKADYTRDGLRVLERDTEGRPTRAGAVVYRTEPDRKGVPHLVEEDAGRLFEYIYTSPGSPIGVPVEITPKRSSP